MHRCTFILLVPRSPFLISLLLFYILNHSLYKRKHKLVVFLTLMISSSIGFPTNDMIHWLWLNKTPLCMYTSAVFQICTLFSRSLISEGYFHKGHGNLQLLFDPHPCLLNSTVCCAWWVTWPRSLLPFMMLGLSPSYPICSIQFLPLPKPHIVSGISYPCHSLCSSKSELLAAFSTPCDTATVTETKTTLVLCQSYPPASVILSVGGALSSHFPSLPGSVLHPDQSSLHSILRLTPLITSPAKMQFPEHSYFSACIQEALSEKPDAACHGY